MYILHSYSPLTKEELTEIKNSADDLWYLPPCADILEYMGNFTDDTKVEVIEKEDELYEQLKAF